MWISGTALILSGLFQTYMNSTVNEKTSDSIRMEMIETIDLQCSNSYTFIQLFCISEKNPATMSSTKAAVIPTTILTRRFLLESNVV